MESTMDIGTTSSFQTQLGREGRGNNKKHLLRPAVASHKRSKCVVHVFVLCFFQVVLVLVRKESLVLGVTFVWMFVSSRLPDAQNI